MNGVDALKARVRTTLPAPVVHRVQSFLARRFAMRVESALAAAGGGRVVGGPFAGMLLPERASWGRLWPMWAGTYELELRDAVESLVAMAPRRILDVGCAEGYYAVGMALRCPDAEVVAHDIDPDARAACAETAILNGVGDRVLVRGECSAATLIDEIIPSTVVIMDCEGAELTLLDPVAVPGLRTTTILVEIHDFVDRSIGATIAGRFVATHCVDLLVSVPRVADDLPSALSLPERAAHAVMDEGRPQLPHPMSWAWMRPRQ